MKKWKMSRRPGLALAATGLLIALALPATPTPTATAAAPTPAERETAMQLYARAREEAKHQRFDVAAHLFEQAYRLDPSATLLFNVATALENGGRMAEARVRLREYLVRSDTSYVQKMDAHKRLAALERRLGLPLTPLPAAPPVVTTIPMAHGGEDVRAPEPHLSQPHLSRPHLSRPHLRSARVLGTAAIRDGDRSYRLAAMSCHWNGHQQRFDGCSLTHAWGGNAGFDLSPRALTSKSNGIFVSFDRPFRGSPYCSVELRDLVALRRLHAQATGVSIHLYEPGGKPLDWARAVTWLTIVCHGVE